MIAVFRAFLALLLGAVLLSGCGEVVNIFITVDDDDLDYAANSDPWPEEAAEEIAVELDERNNEESNDSAFDSDNDSSEDSADTSDE
ncbi:MAG: hypothetical protein OXT74_01665 [Candidatus Poribacteria bacterium]|nr:hypothetical protein [Candidatus Poribacteria bacterium]